MTENENTHSFDNAYRFDRKERKKKERKKKQYAQSSWKSRANSFH